MTQGELKELTNLGAELGAAKAEVERLREELRKIANLPMGRCSTENDYRLSGAKAMALAAISKQAEPTDTFTAVEMATAAAQGFRDGQAAVEPATAQDEREAPIVVATAILGGIFHGGSGPELGEIDIEVCTSALEKIQCETVNSSDDAFLPLMTVAQHERIVAALTRPAQTAPQGKFRMGDLVKKSTGSEWVGRVVGWYSTEQTPEGYAVESSAHRNSVQIYPAKALEAV